MEYYNQHDPWPTEEIYSPNISTTEFEEEYEEEMEYVRYPVLNKPKKERHRHEHEHQNNEAETVSTIVEKSDDGLQHNIDASTHPKTTMSTRELRKRRKVTEKKQEDANASDNNDHENDSETIITAPPRYRSAPRGPIKKSSKKTGWDIRPENRRLVLEDMKYIMEMFGGPSKRVQARTNGPRPKPKRTPTPPGFYGMFSPPPASPSSPHFFPTPTGTEPSAGPNRVRNVIEKSQKEEEEECYEEEAVLEGKGDDYEESGEEAEGKEEDPSPTANATTTTPTNSDPDLDNQHKLVARTLNFMVRARTHGIDVSDFESLSAVSRKQWKELAANSIPNNNKNNDGEKENEDKDKDKDEVARNASHVAQVLLSDTSPRTLRRLARHASILVEELEVLGVKI